MLISILFFLVWKIQWKCQSKWIINLVDVIVTFWYLYNRFSLSLYQLVVLDTLCFDLLYKAEIISQLIKQVQEFCWSFSLIFYSYLVVVVWITFFPCLSLKLNFCVQSHKPLIKHFYFLIFSCIFFCYSETKADFTEWLLKKLASCKDQPLLNFVESDYRNFVGLIFWEVGKNSINLVPLKPFLVKWTIIRIWRSIVLLKYMQVSHLYYSKVVLSKNLY